MKDNTTHVLEKFKQSQDEIFIPDYLAEMYKQFPATREKDNMKGLNFILSQASNLSKPAISLLGPYSAGKTFILNYLIRDKTFISQMKPTTSVITVIRHVSDKPSSWPENNVYTLKKGVDLRTLDYNNVTGKYSLEDLHSLTTYSDENKQQNENTLDAVIVFLDKDILKQCIFFDCPGVGTMAEAEHLNDEKLSDEQEHYIREKELQKKAIINADAHLILSTLMGKGGFADADFGNILASITSNMSRFPTRIPHGNLLLVGTLADPRSEHLKDEGKVLQDLRLAVEKQVSGIPAEKRNSIDLVSLKKRIVLFWDLDPTQIETAVASKARTIKKYEPSLTEKELYKKATDEFNEENQDLLRTKAFDAAVHTLIEQLLLGIDTFRAQLTNESLRGGIQYYHGENTKYLHRSANQRSYEELSRRYDNEKSDREKNWCEITKQFEKDVQDYRATAIREVEKTFSYWTQEDYVYKFLERKFGDDKEQAKRFASDFIQEQINDDVSDAFANNVSIPHRRVEERLVAFDKKWFVREYSTHDANGISLGNAQSSHLLRTNIETVSAAQTFGTLAAGLAGGTTLLAVGGSTLAQAAMLKVIALTVGGLGTVGLGGAAAGLLAGIPIYGWIAGGVLGMGYAIYKFFAWRKAMAASIVKSMKKEMSSAIRDVTKNINAVFDNVQKLGVETLAKTKEVLDAHVHEVHQMGKHSVSSKQLEQSALFYQAHTAVLEKTLAALQVEWESNNISVN